jgi:hypothetical protein
MPYFAHISASTMESVLEINCSIILLDEGKGRKPKKGNSADYPSKKSSWRSLA